MADTNNPLVEAEDTMRGRFLMFTLGADNFGIEIKYVTEIVGIQPIIAMPEVPNYMKGIINLRGKIVPVIDIRLKFKKEPIEYTDRTCIVVIDTNALSVGIIVDSVSEVLGIDDENIVPPPSVGTSISNRYMQGIGKAEDKIILLLDCQELFLENECSAIQDIA